MITINNTQGEVLDEVVAGNGHCQVNGCSCPSFVDVPGKWPDCARCGHPFKEHF